MTTITPEDFRDFRLRYGSTRTVADACDVTERQVRRWETGESRVPAWTMPYLRMRAGDLGAIDPQWHGWHLRDHCLHSPGARGPAWDIYTLCAIASHLTSAERKELELQRRINVLEREIGALRQQLREATDQVEQLSLFSIPAKPQPLATVLPFPALTDPSEPLGYYPHVKQQLGGG